LRNGCPDSVVNVPKLLAPPFPGEKTHFLGAFITLSKKILNFSEKYGLILVTGQQFAQGSLPNGSLQVASSVRCRLPLE